MIVEENLRILDLPVLIIRGDADAYLSAAVSDRLHSEIPNSRLEHIHTGRHYIREDEPKKLVEIIVQSYRELHYADQ